MIFKIAILFKAIFNNARARIVYGVKTGTLSDTNLMSSTNIKPSAHTINRTSTININEKLCAIKDIGVRNNI